MTGPSPGIIVPLTTRAFTITVDAYLNGPGAAWRDRVRPLAYEDIRRPDDLPAGTYLFTDMERLSPMMTIRVAGLADHLASRADVRILNHPVRSMRRYELLRALYEDGTNPFNVFRLTEHRRPSRFPVFLRRDDGHDGPLSVLLDSQEMLDRAIEVVMRHRYQRDTILIVEFADTRSPDGLFRKRSIWRVGEAFFAAHIHANAGWEVKVTEAVDPENVAAERAFFDSPDLEAVARPLFERARIAFGRLDYALRDGRPVVWEINTNPNWWSTTYERPERRALGDIWLARMSAALDGLLGKGTLGGSAA